MKRPLQIFINSISVNTIWDKEYITYHGDGTGDFEVLGDGVENVQLLHDYVEHLSSQLTIAKLLIDRYEKAEI